MVDYVLKAETGKLGLVGNALRIPEPSRDMAGFPVPPYQVVVSAAAPPKAKE